MSVQDSSSLPQVRPTGDDRAAWRNFWEQSGQSWRTEPEIDEERQKYLAERRTIIPDIEKGIYPFRNIVLSRADVEWLLATHEHGQGPVDWSDESQQEREGLDVRGANLFQVDLQNLPLARLHGGLTTEEWRNATEEQRNEAAVRIERPNLYRAHLEGAYLGRAHLEKANLSEAHLEHAYLGRAHLEGAYFWKAHLEGAYLGRAHLEKAILDEVILSNEKNVGPWLVDIRWSDVNLAVVKWSQVHMLGDEHEARQKKRDGKVKNKATRLEEYEIAVRSNRQLAVVLQSQGLNEDASRFAYRAQKLQRVVMRFQHKYIQYLFSLLLDLLAGYGYRPIRTLLWYVLVVGGFAAAYALSGHLPALPDALVYSLTSFHGRGFFPGLGSETTLHNPLVVLAAGEAVIGLFIEISFIATFTQRYFGK
jgi:uncharacterized protein YjbI with pentapeptide repeats